jgi:hypothetical protein
MDTLRCFLTDQTDNRELFRGLAVESSNVWDRANSAPVFHFSFKELTAESYRDAIFDMASRYLEPYCPELRASAFKGAVRGYLAERRRETDALRFLTDAVYEATGKKSHVFIDEYDKLLADKAGSESHDGIREFLAYLFSAVFKDNPSLEKGLLTGVMRVSYEGLFSGLNNIAVFDVFRDSTYCRDFGITEEEMREIASLREIDAEGVRDWYNGFAIGGAKLYNIFSVSSYLRFRQFDRYWGNSGTMGAVAEAIRSGGPGAPAGSVSGGQGAQAMSAAGGQTGGAAGAGRLNTLARIAAGEQATVPVAQLFSLAQINASDAAFYSLLIQTGYLAIADSTFGRAAVCAPNQEMSLIWKDFIFNAAMPNSGQPMIDLFAERDPERFSAALEQIMADTLSYWDLKGELEYVYHVFLLGGLAFSAAPMDKPKIKSNRESGDGRYDIWMERGGINYIFELKKCKAAKQLESKAKSALRQIDGKRYGDGLDKAKPLWKVGVSFFGKQCKAKCEVEEK